MADTLVDDPSDSGLASIHTPLSTSAYLRAMWDRREFAVEVPLEQMRTAHKTTLLGNVWHLGNPLLTIAVYYLIFGALLGGGRPDNFLLWLTIGVFAFRQTQSVIMGGATALPSNIGLMRAMRFPRALLPISVAISNLLTFAVELGVLGAILILTGGGISRRWLLLPVVLLIHTALNLGGAFVSARLNDNFRDIQQLIPFFFRLLQYVSGVMIPVERLVGENAPQWARTILELNPMWRIIDFYRWVMLGTPLDVAMTLRTALLSVALLWFGFRYFRAAEWRYGRS